MTASRRILLHMAAATGVVIAVSTAVAYAIVFSGTKQRDLKHLETYVTERVHREGIGFQQVESNLALVRGQFLKRLEEPRNNDVSASWDKWFRLFPDGSWRTREEFNDGRRWSTLWAHRDTKLTPDLQNQILRAQDICNEVMPGWVDSFVSLYFVLQGPLNMGFDPRIPTWVWDTPADYDTTELEWYQLAMPKGKPPQGFGWTGVIEEPTTKMPLVSVYLPIERDGQFLGSIGHDVNVHQLMAETAQSQFPGAMHVIFRRDGRIIAHPTKRAEILASKGQLRMQDSGEPALASLYAAVNARKEYYFSGYDRDSGSYYTVARLAGPDWHFLTTLPRKLLHQQAFASAQWVLWSGLLSLALVLGFMATTLQREIAQPLAELTRATRQMGTGDVSARADVPRQNEFGTLAASFNDMAARVGLRDAELRQLNLDLEHRVDKRTTELTDANRKLDEGRAEALRLLARERELSELKNDFVSLVSHEFRTPLEVIISSADNLQRYHDRLPPEKREQLLRTISRSVRRMSGMMEEVLVLGRVEAGQMQFNPTDFDLGAFCHRLRDEIQSATGSRCSIQLTMNAGTDPAHGDEDVLRHIFTNLLSNAVKYSAPGRSVDFFVERDGKAAVVQIADRGCGIPTGDQKRLFQAFHRGSNVRQIPGTGLGLLIVHRCTDLHGGEIHFHSVENEGTTFTVRLPLFPPANPIV